MIIKLLDRSKSLSTVLTLITSAMPFAASAWNLLLLRWHILSD